MSTEFNGVVVTDIKMPFASRWISSQGVYVIYRQKRI
jgi:hypothetical protein